MNELLEKFFKTLTTVLSNANVSGSFNGTPFQKVSFAASGKNAFVVKGWLDTEEGPAIRYRADWDKLQSGEIFFQSHPSNKGWQETKDNSFSLDRTGDEIAIVLNFQTEDGDGRGHEVRFSADIELDPKWWKNL